MNSDLFEAVKNFISEIDEGQEKILWRNIGGKKVYYEIGFDGINYSLRKYIIHEDFTENFEPMKNLMITYCAKLVCE